MRSIVAITCVIGTLVGLAAPAQAQGDPAQYSQAQYTQAQYYGDRPPPPPPGYYPPPVYERVPFGRRCEAVLRTPYGPQPLICRIIQPKPLGEPCACPPPPPPPGYAPGPYVGGRTIR